MKKLTFQKWRGGTIFRKSAISFALQILIALFTWDESRAEEAADVLSPELRRLIYRFDSDDFSRVEEWHRQIAEIEDYRGQILTFIEKGIELGDIGAETAGINALGTTPFEPKLHERLRAILNRELAEPERLKDPSLLPRLEFEDHNAFRKRNAPHICRCLFAGDAIIFLRQKDEDIVAEYLKIQNLGLVDKALIFFDWYGTPASIDVLQAFEDNPPDIPSVPKAAWSERIQSIIKKIRARESQKPSEQGGALNTCPATSSNPS